MVAEAEAAREGCLNARSHAHSSRRDFRGRSKPPASCRQARNRDAKASEGQSRGLWNRGGFSEGKIVNHDPFSGPLCSHSNN